MADYQYQPDENDPVSKLRDAMGRMDGMSNIIMISSRAIDDLQWTVFSHIAYRKRKKTTQ